MVRKATLAISVAVLLAGAAAPAVASAPQSEPVALSGDRVDPAEKVNRKLFAFHQFLDRTLLRPLAMAYKAITPKPLRLGIENVISNLGEPVVAANDLIQGRFRKAGTSTVRFVTNSTLGIGGLIDVATAGDLPHHDNGFALTLGRAGVKPGPYLFIPLLGPSTLRDLIGNGVDAAASPFQWLIREPAKTDYIVSKTIVGGLDTRASVDADYTALFAEATDPYATLRSVYLQNQQSKIDDSTTATPAALPDFDDGSASPPPPAASPPASPPPQAAPPAASPPAG
jgi:phospholipid-binding lipoprotein MlaA